MIFSEVEIPGTTEIKVSLDDSEQAEIPIEDMNELYETIQDEVAEEAYSILNYDWTEGDIRTEKDKFRKLIVDRLEDLLRIKVEIPFRIEVPFFSQAVTEKLKVWLEENKEEISVTMRELQKGKEAVKKKSQAEEKIERYALYLKLKKEFEGLDKCKCGGKCKSHKEDKKEKMEE